MNRADLIGRLTADPEPPSQPGRPARFSVATDDYNPSTKQKEATFHRCVAWGRAADVLVNYAQKGRQVRVTGRISHREYTDKNGQKQRLTEIVVNDVELLGSNPNSQKSQGEDQTNW